MPHNLASQFQRLIRINVFPNILNDAMVVPLYLVTPEVSALEADLINWISRLSSVQKIIISDTNGVAVPVKNGLSEGDWDSQKAKSDILHFEWNGLTLAPSTGWPNKVANLVIFSGVMTAL